MSTVVYTAKREIEKTAFLKTGTDLSAAAGDDSFNSVTTDLSGVLSGQWIYASGFTNAANNGWHQVNGNSTATKIVTTSSLTTETAGASVTLQGYKRGDGQLYTLEFKPTKLDRSEKFVRQKAQALGGARETLFQRSDVFWDVNSGPLIETDVPQFREFLASVAAGETFVFDPYGTLGAPDNSWSVEIDIEQYQEDRISMIRLYNFPFRVRVL
jgi:hypothetical protein